MRVRLTNKDEIYEDEKLTKLQKIENAEDEFGLDILVFLDLANNKGFYGREKGSPDGEIVKIPFNYGVDFQNKRVMHAYGMTQNDVSYYYFTDYGKTWAINKESLES